jgi:regulator of RNase E activity RraA
MSDLLTKEQIEALRSIDTPTICNAIETFKVRGRVEGFLGMDIRCLLPDLGVMVGYAITVMVDSTTPDIPRDPLSWLKWMQAMEASPKPGVLVFKDVGPQPRKSAHFGEVMGTISKRLGVVGLVTDGGVRDILEIQRLGLHYFAAGLAPSHGNARLLDFNLPVEIDGVCIQPGDLIHGDINGVTVIPGEIAAGVVAAAQTVRENEASLMDYVNSPDFSVEGLYQKKFTH